ncbi:Crp/Fnr family transcriptional regulator [Candidatus Peregrinibacteria bacterium]|nr:Crp/Fnr family transcriptional regulator [Candidatus Peregrinibacteria bacterium]
MTPEQIWYLKQVDLFRGMSDKEIKRIGAKMTEKKCVKKEIIYTPFDETNSVFILKQGEVTLYHSYRGKKLIMDTLKPGSIFGNIHFEPQKHTHFAEVTENAHICILEVDDFMNILHSRPDLMIRLLRDMSERLRKYERKLKGGLYDAKEKIVHQLELRECKGGLLKKIFRKECKITHEKLAQLTGLSRETVTRALNALKKEGLISTKDGSIALAEK